MAEPHTLEKVVPVQVSSISPPFRPELALSQVFTDTFFQHLKDNITPFDILAGSPSINVWNWQRQTRLLKSLSLVHSAWVSPAQAIFKRRLIKAEDKDVNVYLQSPLLGPWVCEVVLMIDNDHETFDIALYEELFSRIPTVRAMSIILNVGEKRNNILHGLLRLTNQYMCTIEALWIYDYPSPYRSMDDRFDGISEDLAPLTELRFLSVSCNIHQPYGAMFPPSVKVLELDGNDSGVKDCLENLLRKDEVTLRELSLSFKYHLASFTSFKPGLGVKPRVAFASIQNLYLRLGRGESLTDVRGVLSCCTNLRSLYIFPHNVEVTLRLLQDHIPHSLKRLAILGSSVWFALSEDHSETSGGDLQLAHNATRDSRIDSALSRLVQSLPNLEFVLLNASEYVRYRANQKRMRSLAREVDLYGNEMPVPLHFVMAKQTCNERNIQFTCKRFDEVSVWGL